MPRKLTRGERENALLDYKYRLADKTPASRYSFNGEACWKIHSAWSSLFLSRPVSYLCINGCSRNSSFWSAFYRVRSSRTPSSRLLFSRENGEQKSTNRIEACNYDLTIRWRGKWIWFLRSISITLTHTHSLLFHSFLEFCPPRLCSAIFPLLTHRFPTALVLPSSGQTSFPYRRHLLHYHSAAFYRVPLPLSPSPPRSNIFLLRRANNNRTIFLLATVARLIPLRSDSFRFVSFLIVRGGNGTPGVLLGLPLEVSLPVRSNCLAETRSRFGSRGNFFSADIDRRVLAKRGEIESRIVVARFLGGSNI